MAFGGVATEFVPGSQGASAKPAYVRITGLTLAARVGAPSIAAADTGQFTTGTPVANQNQLTVNFGRGAGNWVAGDENLVECIVNAPADDITAGSIAYVVAVGVVAGNLVTTLHNRGAGATGALDIKFGMLD